MWWLSWFKRSSAACNPGPSVCGGKSECFSIMYSCFHLSLIIVLQPLSCLVYHTTEYMVPGRWGGLQSALGLTWGTGTQEENPWVSDKTFWLSDFSRFSLGNNYHHCEEAAVLGIKYKYQSRCSFFWESVEKTQLSQGSIDTSGSET